jgi:hypothetical protein
MTGLFNSVRIPLAVGTIVLLALVIAPLASTTPVSANHVTLTNLPTEQGTPNDFEFADRAEVDNGSCDPGNCAEVGQGEAGEYKTFEFGATIFPEDAIQGIEVTLGGAFTSGDGATLQLLDAGEDPTGDTRAVTISSPGSYNELTAGGPTDLWGISWTASGVIDANFGVSITDSGGTGGFLLDFVSITVHYSDDDDLDGVQNHYDNCQFVANPDQTNTDVFLANNGARIGLPDGQGVIPPLQGDALGDACDSDDDNDTYSDLVEQSLPTNPLDNCYGGPFSAPPGLDPAVANDAWPPDMNGDKQIIATSNVTSSDTDYFQGQINKPADTAARSRLNGYIYNPAIAVADGGDGLTASQTTVGYQSTGDPVGVNHVIRIDSEWMLVTAVDTTNNVLTVTRGYSNSTAATHAETASINDANLSLSDVLALWSGKVNWKCN